MGLLAALRKRSAIRDYVRKLPELLVKDYGFSQSYTALQIKSTVERHKLSTEYIRYAISMYSDRAAFDQFHRGLVEQWNYDAIRGEVQAGYLPGYSHFSITDMLETFPDSAYGEGGSGSHGAAEGHANGDTSSGWGH